MNNSSTAEQSNYSNPRNGKWAGYCINETIGVSSPMEIVINVINGQMDGVLILGGAELMGSGRIQGVVTNGSIAFTSPGCVPIFDCITWMGQISGNEIVGSYRVEPSAEACSQDIPLQVGRFTLTQLNN